MLRLQINKAEFDKFRELQNPKKKRHDCHAAFSTNPSEDTWRFVTLGLTPQQLRVEVRNQSPILDQIFGIFIELPDKHPKGGRFFIDFEGVFWKDTQKGRHRFVEWIAVEPLRGAPQDQAKAYVEMKAKIAPNNEKIRIAVRT
jgi:hypothetical protein